MATFINNKYSRLVLLISGGLTKPMRAMILKIVKDSSPSKPKPWTLDEFLEKKRKLIDDLPDLNVTQLNILFPAAKNGHRQNTDIEKWDISLISIILLEVCIPRDEDLHLRSDINNMRKIRNTILHMGSQEVTDNEFRKLSKDVTEVINKWITCIKDKELATETFKFLRNLATEMIPLSDALSKITEWYNSDKKIERELASVKDRVTNVRDNVEKVDGKVDKIIDHDEKMDGKVDKIFDHGEKMDGKVDQIIDHEEQMDGKLDTMKEEIKQLTQKVNLMLITMIKKELVQLPATEVGITITNCNSNAEKTVTDELIAIINQDLHEYPMLSDDSENIVNLVRKAMSRLLSNGQEVIRAKAECVIMRIRCPSFQSMYQLWQECVDGTATALFQPIQQYFRRLEGCSKVEIAVIVREREVLRCLDIIVSEISKVMSDEHVREESSLVKVKRDQSKHKDAYDNQISVVDARKEQHSGHQSGQRIRLKIKSQSAEQLLHIWDACTSGKVNERLDKVAEAMMKSYGLTDLHIEAKLDEDMLFKALKDQVDLRTCDTVSVYAALKDRDKEDYDAGKRNDEATSRHIAAKSGSEDQVSKDNAAIGDDNVITDDRKTGSPGVDMDIRAISAEDSSAKNAFTTSECSLQTIKENDRECTTIARYAEPSIGITTVEFDVCGGRFKALDFQLFLSKCGVIPDRTYMERQHAATHKRFEIKSYHSKTLYEVLDEAGFNEEFRNTRNEEVESVVEAIGCSIDYFKINQVGVLIGSSVEGTSLSYYDKDWLMINKLFRIKKDEHNTRSHHEPYLRIVKEKHTRLGFSKLQVKLPMPQGHSEMEYLEHLSFYAFERDSKNRVFIKNHSKKVHPYSHGPKPPDCWDDCAYAYACSEIPDDVKPWFERERKHDWPSKETCVLLNRLGCVLVPVGHPSSVDRDLEWRISMVLQERHLMLNLNPVQYKCFILLKTTMHHIENLCKTALFYTIENNDQSIWLPEKLMICFKKCLVQLLDMINKYCCPDYFLPERNLFETKIRPWQLLTVKQLLNDLLGDDIWLLQHVYMCDLIYLSGRRRMQRSIISEMSLKHTLIQTVQIMADHEHSNDIDTVISYLLTLLKYFRECIERTLNSTPNTIKPDNTDISADYSLCLDASITWSSGMLNIPPEELPEPEKFFICKALRLLIEHIQSKLARLFVIKGIEDPQVLFRANSFIETGESTDSLAMDITIVTVQFMQALHSICREDMNKLMDVLNESCVCVCSYCVVEQHLSYLQNQKKLQCIWFDRFDIVIVPASVVWEIYRSFGKRTATIACEEIRPSGPSASFGNRVAYRSIKDRGEDLAIVSPLVYLYFLQYENSKAMSNRVEMNATLCKLEKHVLEQLNSRSHVDTTLNLLGHIYATKGWHRLALECFRRSWRIQPEFNAAKWHVMWMLFT